MAVTYDHKKLTKVLLAEDSHDSLVDALTDLMLLNGTDDIEEIVNGAMSTAENHYEAERSGESEGYTVLVDPQDRSELVPLKEWVAKLPKGDDDKQDEERYTVRLHPTERSTVGNAYEVLDGGASMDPPNLHAWQEDANAEADRLNSTD